MKKLIIKFCYDSDGGGTNDKFLLLHMAPEHQTESGPKKDEKGRIHISLGKKRKKEQESDE